MPTSIRAVLIERIERLPVVVRTVLQHIAVWGNTIDLETLTGFSATPEEVLVDCIEAATRVGLVRFDEDGRIELCHVLAQEVLYDSVSPLRRQRMHCAAMEFLEAHGPGRSLGAGDPRLLARHAFRGATRATAPAALEYVTSAALHCDRAGSGAMPPSCGGPPWTCTNSPVALENPGIGRTVWRCWTRSAH